MQRARRGSAIASVLAGFALLVAGGVLLPRALTGLLVLLVLIVVCPVVVAMAAVLLLRRRAQRPRAAVLVGVASVGLVMSILLAVFFVSLARALPFVLAIAVVLLGTAPLIIRRASGGTLRAWTRSLVALAAVATGVFCWLWPDLAVVVAGLLVAVGLILLGILMVVRGMRRPRADRVRTQGRWPGILRLAGAVTASLVSVGIAAGSIVVQLPTHRADDFYAFSGEIPTVPGTVVKTEPYDGHAPAGAAAMRILYSSTYSDGQPALVSAVVAYPLDDAEDASRTVLAWEHGTTGITQSCAPSMLDDALSEEAIPGIGQAIDNGWAVVATDYPGQGTAGRYPYLIGEGEGRATLDAVRAAGHIDEVGASNETLLWGHSQGGHASLWAGQIAETYAPELRIKGVAALSAAADPLFEARTVTAAGGAVSSVVTPYMVVPYADEYDDIRIAELVHPAGISIVDAMASRCAFDTNMLASVLSATAVAQDAPLFALDLESGPVVERLEQNVADGIVPAPLFLGQGIDDEVIPIETQRKLAASLEEAERDIEVHEYEGRTHMGVVAPDSPLIDDLYAWADELG